MKYNKQQLEAKDFYTINRLSELIGADRRTLNKRLATEEPDYVLGKSSYYDLDRVSDILEEASGQGSDKQQLECSKLVAQIENITLRNKEISRTLIPQADIAKVWSASVGQARNQLIAIEELAPVLCGLGVNEIKAKLKEAINGVITTLHNCPVEDEQKSNKDTK
jgi:hypothetical protein